MELGDYARVTWKWLWLIVLCTVIAAAGTWLVDRERPAQYETSTTLLIGRAVQKSDPSYSDFDFTSQLGQTYSQLIETEQILVPTAAALGIEGQWKALRDQISVDLLPGTLLMKIKVIDTDPQRAKLIADVSAQQLIGHVGTATTSSDYKEFIAEQAASFPPKIEAAQQEIVALEAKLGEAFSARQIQEIQAQISSLEQQIYNWQTTFAEYETLLGVGSVNQLSVVEYAAIPTTPVGPGWKRDVLFAAAAGCLLAALTAFLIEYLDDTLKSPQDVGKTMGLVTLGAIPGIEGDSPSAKLFTARHPKSPVSEAFRAMRTNLRYSSLDHPVKSVLFTSPGPGEGKSTMLANLGVAMAQDGNSVILVDSDLRRPMLHTIFQLRNKEGLTTALLAADPMLDGQLQETGVPNLRVMTSGPLPPNPSELLGSRRMQQLIEQLEHEADIVLFDTPPVQPVTDAAVLGTQVDGVVLVADAGRTRRAAACGTRDSLQQVGARLLGVVLNRLPERGARSYYYYYYTEGRSGRRGLRAKGR